MSLIVVGADTVAQVQELAKAAASFRPMSPEQQQLLVDNMRLYGRRLMYYKP
ncbi:MAG: hypothetical protein ACUVRZ_02285 [Desulfobacca sp.]|uniref:hypothetical protein n=1 Tax=Desulfobacca sp. TaxID=2067990 RepID=UPI00404ACE6F